MKYSYTKIAIEDLKEKMIACLTAKGIFKNDARVIIEPYLEAELFGKLTHGVSKFFDHYAALVKIKKTKPKIIKNKFNYILIDGKGGNGHMTALHAVKLL